MSTASPMSATSAPPAGLRVGYVLKMYPRFSETFIVHEILHQEALGTEVEIFSLRLPVDGRFHEALADVRAPVTYLAREHKVAPFWDELATAAALVPEVCEHLDELLASPPDEALAAVQVAAAVRRDGLQHLHAHFGSVATAVARLAARLTGIGYSFTAHAKDIFHEDVDRSALSDRLRDASAVVTVSDYNLDHLRDEHGTAADRVVRLYNSVDLERFPYQPKGEHAATPRLAAVGRLVEKKGFADLLRATSLLTEAGREVHVDLVGAGPEEARLRRLVGELGLTAQVTLHGALPQSRVHEVVAAAEVLVAPCIVGADGNRDGLPTVLLEGLALGTPTVATPVTGIPELVRHGETGLLVPESSPAELAAAVLRILDDREGAARRAFAARRLLEAEFDIRQHARELHEIFRAAVDEPARDVAS